jgi:fatty-acyl-CoA synthase
VELLGRESVTINTGGEKVFAEEVERALAACPGVTDAIVVGRPSERWGQEVVAVVVVGGGTTDEDILAACAAHLARYKLPKAIIRVDEVRRSPSGKPDYAWATGQAAGISR